MVVCSVQAGAMRDSPAGSSILNLLCNRVIFGFSLLLLTVFRVEACLKSIILYFIAKMIDIACNLRGEACL